MGVSGGAGAFSLVLHTWTQDLQLHLQVHVVMSCGVLDPQGQWHRPARKPDFLFPVQALSKVFRGKFMATLAQAHSSGQIAFDPQRSEPAWSQRQKQLYKHDGVEYAKTPLGGPAQVLEHLWAHCVVANRLFSRAKRRTLRLALPPKSGRQNAQLITLRALRTLARMSLGATASVA